MYIGAGSKNENAYTVGASHLLERMAFRATTNRSSFRVTREAEVIGANLMVRRGSGGVQGGSQGEGAAKRRGTLQCATRLIYLFPPMPNAQ